MRIQLAVSFSETWRKKNTHTHESLLLYRPTILLPRSSLYFFSFNSASIMDSQRAISFKYTRVLYNACARTHLIKVDGNTKRTMLLVHWNNSFTGYMWDKLLCRLCTCTNTFYRRRRGQIHFS